jgi:hypothetical protein
VINYLNQTAICFDLSMLNKIKYLFQKEVNTNFLCDFDLEIHTEAFLKQHVIDANSKIAQDLSSKLIPDDFMNYFIDMDAQDFSEKKQVFSRELKVIHKCATNR